MLIDIIKAKGSKSMLLYKGVKEMKIILKEFFYGLDFSDATSLPTIQVLRPSFEPSYEMESGNAFQEEWSQDNKELNPYE